MHVILCMKHLLDLGLGYTTLESVINNEFLWAPYTSLHDTFTSLRLFMVLLVISASKCSPIL
jgi:hypothetical protein